MAQAEDKGTDTVQVALRIRPLMQQEMERGCDECIKVVPGEPQVQIKDLAFTYNYVFPQHITQQEFYDTAVKGLIGKLFQGYNLTILAYGQTGSGKTYTMGTNYSGSDGDSSKHGVIPQAIADIFEYIINEDMFEFKVKASFMELYQEQCFDLLSGKERHKSAIDIREDLKKGVILPGITEVAVSSIADTMMVLAQGSTGRMTRSTAMNQASSRSHAIFTITITKESRTDKSRFTTSRFHLVDLAGSERIKKTKASGERLKEGVKINQGLLALGNVISALGDGTTRSFISYRDSKLTRLLQDSLGGNSLTLMVACVSPAVYNLDETVSTLRYADRARQIRNKPVINQDPKAAELLRLNNLVNELRLQFIGKLPTVSEHNYEQLRDELDKERSKYAELLKKYKYVTEHPGNMLIENTNLCEKALLAEAAKDQIERKLIDLTDQSNQTLEDLNKSEKCDDDLQKTSVVDYFKEDKCELEDLHSIFMKTDEELIDHEIKLSFVNEDVKGGDEVEDDVLTEDHAVLEEENRRTMGQSNDPSHEHRTKVSKLESEIMELKKLCQQQANTIKIKETYEGKITALNAELQAMKVTKVRLMKQMRQESEKFRKWKADNEHEMMRLKKEDRKRATAMAKMEALHAKQQGVLKRKMEEVVAVKKRLKVALDHQKMSQMKRSAEDNVPSNAVHQYIEQELEVHLSIVEAEKSLEELMENRALVMDQIQSLRDSTGTLENKKITELENDLQFRKAQISDLQQKILTADQENKSRTQWDSIQSMEEAKVALKVIFELLVDTKRELHNLSEKSYQGRYEEVKEAYDRLAAEFDKATSEYEIQVATIKIETERKAQRTRLATNFGEPSSSRGVRRPSPGAGNCTCRGTCGNKQCGCVKSGRGCSTPCRCQRGLCRNRRAGADSKAQRSRLNEELGEPSSLAVSRSTSPGAGYCTCRGVCGNKQCGCVKSERGCSTSCRCRSDQCQNRRAGSDAE